jgi:hypothetical protein
MNNQKNYDYEIKDCDKFSKEMCFSPFSSGNFLFYKVIVLNIKTIFMRLRFTIQRFFSVFKICHVKFVFHKLRFSLMLFF